MELNTQTQATEQTAATAVSEPKLLTMEISKLVGKEGEQKQREKVGEVSYYAPTLKDVGINSEPTKVDEKTGELTYASDLENFVYGALLTAAKTAARNKLMPATATVRNGAKVPTTLAELIAPAETSGQALIDRRALVSLFKTHLAGLQISEAARSVLLNFFEKPEFLATQQPDVLARLKARYMTFAEEVSEKLTDWQGNYLVNVIEGCDADASKLDF